MAFINTDQGIMYEDSHIQGIKTKISMVLNISNVDLVCTGSNVFRK